MRTLHLIHGPSNCGSLKIALCGAAEEPYDVWYYPLPLSCFSLPRSTSENELERVNREYRKNRPYYRFGKEIKEFLNPDLSKYDRVVVWWSNRFNPSTHLILHLVCRFYPECNLFQRQYDVYELDDLNGISYPGGMKPITPEERANYAAQYDELVKNDTHLRMYADKGHTQIASFPEDYYDQEILSLCKAKISLNRLIGEMMGRFVLEQNFIEERIILLHQSGKLEVSKIELLINPFLAKEINAERMALTVKANNYGSTK